MCELYSSSSPRNGPLRISPKYTVLDWSNLELRDPDQNEPDWQTAMDIFEDRIKGRFLDIVDRFQIMGFSGFAVMAIDCLLIETLYQFQKGIPFSSISAAAFEQFLIESNHFKGDLPTKDQRLLVFDHFRNGIFHQAELKGASRVLSVGPLAKPAEDGPGLIINRKKFHQALVWTLSDYVCAVRKHSPVDLDTRWKFRAKMNYICRMPQHYMAYRDEITSEKLESTLGKLGKISLLGQGIVDGWKKVEKRNRNNEPYYTIEEDKGSYFSGRLYVVNVYQLDKIAKNLEEGREIIPVKLIANGVHPWQPVWVFKKGK